MGVLRSSTRAKEDVIIFCGGKDWPAWEAGGEGERAVAAKENKKILIGPDDGAHLPIVGITHKVTAKSFGGAFTSIEARLAPGEMIPPHTHTREDECAFVLEGELTFDVGGQIAVAQAGSFVLKPRGIYHAFGNTGTEVAHVLEFHTPGGFESYYDEYERIVQGAMEEE